MNFVNNGTTKIRNKKGKLKSRLKKSLNNTFFCWKGGEFTFDESTYLWVANDGNSGGTGIVGLFDQGYHVILQTFFFEY